LPGLLITPVSRLPRYLLLLRDLRRHTPPEHADYQALDSVLTQLTEICNDINARVRQMADERVAAAAGARRP